MTNAAAKERRQSVDGLCIDQRSTLQNGRHQLHPALGYDRSHIAM